jgi:putative nucleotidyltransferase with HDIG domain
MPGRKLVIEAQYLAKEVQAITKKVTSLPTLPTIYTALCQVMENPHSTIPEVVEIVSGDKTTVSRILRLVNSAAYGLNRRVETVSQAVVLVGVQEVKNLVLASSVMKYFPEQSNLQMTPEEFWEHSIAVGLATRMLGRAIGMTDVESLYVAGLLHDIGKLFFIANLQEEFGCALMRAREQQTPIGTAEKLVLGVDHAEAGAALADHWRLPEYLKLVIRHHHRLLPASPYKTTIALVHTADYWVRSLALGNPGDPFVPHPRKEAWQLLPVKAEMFEKLTDMLLREHKQIVNQLMTS